MKKIYVVCEDLTNEFFGLYPTLNEAKERVRDMNGYILEYPYEIKDNQLIIDLEANNDDWES